MRSDSSSYDFEPEPVFSKLFKSISTFPLSEQEQVSWPEAKKVAEIERERKNDKELRKIARICHVLFYFREPTYLESPYKSSSSQIVARFLLMGPHFHLK